MAWSKLAIRPVIGDLYTTTRVVHHTQVEEKLPGQLLVPCQLDCDQGRATGVALSCHWWCRLITTCLGSGIGKEILYGEPHRLHNALQGTAGKAFEQDLPL